MVIKNILAICFLSLNALFFQPMCFGSSFVVWNGLYGNVSCVQRKVWRGKSKILVIFDSWAH